MKREKDVEGQLKREVERRGGWCLKLTSTVGGLPDRLCLFPGGKLAFAELKAPGRSPRPLQLRQMKRLSDLGFTVCVIDGEEGIRELLGEVI